METAERHAIERALRRAAWNKRRAARMLGIGKTTLYRKIRLHSLEKPGRSTLCSYTPRTCVAVGAFARCDPDGSFG